MTLPDRRVTSRNETPVFIPAGPERLFGIFTVPTGKPKGVAVIFLQGGGYVLSTNHNRVWVDLCRRVAGSGCHSMRLDYRGVGESTGRFERIHLDRVQVDDLEAALDWIRRQGVQRLIVVGSCLGARIAVAAAPKIVGLQGLVLIGAPVGGVDVQGPTMASLGPSVTGNFADGLLALARRQLPCLVVYGTEDSYRDAFRRAAAGPLQEMLNDPTTTVETVLVPGQLPGLPSLRTQQVVGDTVVAWIRRLERSNQQVLAGG
jgi:alpha/beta superfamily hydrolase